MLISEIIPYARNARNNEKAIPKVAESIKEFGLRGTIGLESKANPVIVWGHTRVEACKSLGWSEIPDSKIEYCDDLTAEQVKAFRIADNKTGSIATYNKSMLREEVRSLKDFDMARVGIDFKSKHLPYGAERLKTGFCFAGIPKESTVAVSTVGVMRDDAAKEIWRDGMREALKRLRPLKVLVYGAEIGFDYGQAEVRHYKSRGRFDGR